MRRAHREILRYQDTHGLPESPRTTIVACVVQGGRAWWAHAGDSRLYLLRDGRVLIRTRDHSKVQSLIDLGLIDERDSCTHPERNKVMNCLGSPFEPTIELGGDVALEPGDTLMLCSDGVWSALPEDALIEPLTVESVLSGVPRLVQQAVGHAGPMADNATVLAMTWESDVDGAVRSSQDVPEGAITTTIAVGMIEENAPGETLTEDEIERTIREIREAISRGGAH
jgi:protein phosphatase